MQIEKFEGLIAAPFTPMDTAGDINPGKVSDLADNLKENRVKGAFILGSTGEGVSLTMEEKRTMVQAWKQEERSNFKVIALVASNSLREASAFAGFLETVGVYGLAVLPPFYFKPHSTSALVDYVRQVAKNAPQLPVYYYHIPALTGVNHSMHEFLTLAGDIPNFAGIKYTAPDLMDYRKCLTFDNGRFDLLWGMDEILISAMAMGARGGVGSTYNYAAPLYYEMMEAFESGDLHRARYLQSKSIEIVDILVRYGGIPVGKHFMKHIGLDCGEFRQPLNRPIDSDRFQADLSRIKFDQYASVGVKMSK